MTPASPGFLAGLWKRLREQNTERVELIYVPGEWRCAKCKLRITSTVFSPDGKIGANRQSEPCPNGCGPLWPLTYREAYEAEAERHESTWERWRNLEKALGHDTPWPLVEILRQFIVTVDHLLIDHNCDTDGHEELRSAKDAADEMIARIAEASQ